MSECAAKPPHNPEEERRKINDRMARVKHKICVLSGKGGVGKSTVAVNLAVALAEAGRRVGLLDVDIHGPSVPTMLGIGPLLLTGTDEAIQPVYAGSLKVMSVGFLCEDADNPFIWRGPMKMGVIRQFLGDVEWGELDYLIVDCPPGTGDEPLSICQLIEEPSGAVIVTTPQQVAAVDVRKSLRFCEKLSMPVLGIVENMSGFTCPKCGEVVDIFLSGGGESMAADFGVPFLGKIPIDPAVGRACDSGRPFIQSHAASETARLLNDIIEPLLKLEQHCTADRVENGRVKKLSGKNEL
ncbi:ATP-binding protein [Verrucomicrobia bacterium S94]|nr:ATP-binding protein [Verrucomicrobia bacterium S94]